MRNWVLRLALLACVAIPSWAQQEPQSDQDSGQNQAPPNSDAQKARARDAEAGQSSSRDTRIDLSPPKDDAKNHPNSGRLPSEAAPDGTNPEAASDVQELHAWDPYRAIKDDEVGDFYFKRRNYKAALARYQDALAWKENDAVATFRMGECYQKLDQRDEAIAQYRQYLKILPEGSFSKDAKRALEKLGAEKAEAAPISSSK